jgi:3-amino-5-hydroxybenzoate synthase
MSTTKLLRSSSETPDGLTLRSGPFDGTTDLALHGGRPSKRNPFPSWPAFDDGELSAVEEVIESRRWWRIAGTQVETFEREFAAYQNSKAAVAVTSGTQALEIALTAADIGAGDEVIVPAFTFISTAYAPLLVNAIPVLVDVRPDDYCIDPDAVRAAITPRTRAIVPVHMAGHVADMDALAEIARKHGLKIIEDAAHGHGAEWKGRRVGALADHGMFSFQSGKLMTAGEGGLILSNDLEYLERCFLLSSCGRPKTDTTYQHLHLASNARLSEMHAAVLRIQLRRLDGQIARREAQARQLDSLLRKIDGIAPQTRDPRVTRHAHYMYMFRYEQSCFYDVPRNRFVEALKAEGIPAFVPFAPIHRTSVFQKRDFGPRWRGRVDTLPAYHEQHLPVTEDIGRNVVWLHHSTLLGTGEELADIAAAIRKIQRRAETLL